VKRLFRPRERARGIGVIIVVGEGRFDVVRVCASLSDALDCRILVVAESRHTIDEETVIDLLDAGADDFVPATTGAPVVLARVRVALRASPLRRRAPQQIVVGDVLIDLDAHVVLVDGEPVSCPPRQFDILVALASNAGLMVLRDTLIADVWGIPPGSVDPRRVRIAISLLRGLLSVGPQRPTIESVSRIGYRLVVPPPAG
jgi:DNA-binding response OmpR family regulator